MGVCFSNRATESNHGESSVPDHTPTRQYQVLQSSDLKCFKYSDLQMATKNFHGDCRLGSGRSGSVYKGWIDQQSFKASKTGTGVAVAIKRLYCDNIHHQTEITWLEEVDHISKISHPNIVSLMGYCLEGSNRLLVYEFVPRGTLDNHLFAERTPLSWSLRVKAIFEFAKALAFLHSAEVNVTCIYLKTSSVLFDSKYNAKLSDFRSIRHIDLNHDFTQYPSIRSIIFVAPEFTFRGAVTPKCDVFSFGVVLMEVLSGQRSATRKDNVAEWAELSKLDKYKLVQHLIDDRVKGQYPLDTAYAIAKLALICVSEDPLSRPNMAEVVQQLETLQENGSTSRN